MTPAQAASLGLLAPDVPFHVFETATLAQSYTVRAASGSGYYVDWGDNTQSWFNGNGGNQTVARTYETAGTYRQRWYFNDPAQVVYWNGSGLGLGGAFPNMTGMAALTDLRMMLNNLIGPLPQLPPSLSVLWAHLNQLSGPLPSLAANAALTVFYASYNSFVGTIPSIAACPLLTAFFVGGNQLTGVIPELSNPVLASVGVENNQLTGYTPSTLATTLYYFDASGNALTQAAVDQILADFLTNAAARPAAGDIYLNGGTNSAPSAAGLASRAAFLALKPGWTVTVNP